MNPIIIDAEFRALIPPLSADERAGLEADIITAGRAIKPLDTWRGILLDGYNRHEICTRLGLRFTTEEVAGIDDREYALLWIERNQLHRRNLPDDQRAAIAFRVGQRVSALAMKERALAANETRWRRQPEVSLSVDVSDKDDTPEPSPPATPKPKRDTRKEVARQAKVSERKVRAIAEIYKKDPEALDRLARGETLIFEERAKQNAEARAAIAFAKPVIPTGRYSCIVIDPPWPMERFARELAPNQVGFDYPTMTEEELTAFPVPAMAEDDCHLFTWTTHRFFPMAQRLMSVGALSTFASSFGTSRAAFRLSAFRNTTANSPSTRGAAPLSSSISSNSFVALVPAVASIAESQMSFTMSFAVSRRNRVSMCSAAKAQMASSSTATKSGSSPMTRTRWRHEPRVRHNAAAHSRCASGETGW
jgi:hypothetical protein